MKTLEDKLGELLKALKLGEIIEKPRPVTGGLLHRMYKVSTSKGVYAIKWLNPQIMERKNILMHYIEAEKFANYTKEHGINAISAKNINDQVVHQIENSWFIVFDWLDGISGENYKINVSQCKAIGETLAKLHQVGKNMLDDEAEDRVRFDWDQRVHDGLASDYSWNKLLMASQDTLETIDSQVSRVLNKARPNVVSHRDLDPKNTLWLDNNMFIIDWESVGSINNKVELLEVALYWSDQGREENKFQAIIQAYLLNEDETIEMLGDALYGVFDSELGWLAYNIDRSLDLRLDESERLLGSDQVEKTLNEILELIDRVPHLAWLIYDVVFDKG